VIPDLFVAQIPQKLQARKVAVQSQPHLPARQKGGNLFNGSGSLPAALWVLQIDENHPQLHLLRWDPPLGQGRSILHGGIAKLPSAIQLLQELNAGGTEVAEAVVDNHVGHGGIPQAG